MIILKHIRNKLKSYLSKLNKRTGANVGANVDASKNNMVRLYDKYGRDIQEFRIYWYN